MQENVFKNRNFLLSFLGAAVSNIAAILYNFAVSFWILELLDNNAVVQGAYLAVSGMTFVLFSPIGGVVCDRFHKGKVMFVCDYLRGSIIVLSALAILFSESNYFAVAVLFIAGVLGNMIAAVFSPASTALLPYILHDEQLLQANSYGSMLSSFQSIVGVILAAVLYAALKPTVLLLLVGVCYILSGVSEMFIRYDEPHSEKKLSPASAFEDMKEGLHYVFGNRSLLALVGVIILINFFLAPVLDNFFPYFLKTDVAGHDYLFSSFLTPESWNSVISIFLGVASILFAMRLSNRKKPDKVGKAVSRWLCFMALLLISLTVCYVLLIERGGGLNAFLLLLCAGSFLIGMALTNINIPVSTSIQVMTDKDKLGKVSAFLNMGSQGLIPIATFLAGVVVEYAGCSALLAICSLGFLVVSVFAVCNKNFQSF